ncbi:hypothetical protein [Methylosinus sp. Sm6]|uniref:hypothetical protein n=1 Tax=Methylosinus sp. Sm6 TaxID=2866948 RepID=UPI001C99E875|nr:hypothetical protein [Methylosinus sp. Sm6]MBY6239803.1 hypothetical protein [Methylosinus sp. Sm6]
MAILFDKSYRLRASDAATASILSERLNAILRDIDLRLGGVEDTSASIAELEDQLKGYGTDRINAVLTPVLSAIRAAADLGGILTTVSYTAMESAVGPKEIVIPPLARDAFAPTAFVSIVSAADPMVAMLARRQAWDRATGILAVDVIEAVGAGAFSEWIVSAAAATQSAGQIRTAPVGALTGDTLAQQLAQTAGALAARQPSAANLSELAELELLGDRILMTSDAAVLALAPLGAFGKALLGAANVTAARSSLELAAVAVSGSASDLTKGTLPAARLPALQNLSLLGGAGGADLGVAGDGDYRVKVIADGSTWIESIRVHRKTGVVDFPQSFTAPVRPNIVQRNWVTSQAWISSSSAADNAWRNMCWVRELGLFVAIASSGTGNRVMTSPDGVNWTARTSAEDNTWLGLCWSPEVRLLVAVASDGTNRVMTSPDGVNWTARAAPAENQWRSVCWARELGVFVAISIDTTSNRVMTSPDGVNWTTHSAPNGAWREVCWAPEIGLLVAVAGAGAGNRVMTSLDGIVWTVRPDTGLGNKWTSVCWARELGLLVAVAEWYGAGDGVMTSPDGAHWTRRASAEDNAWSRVCWAPEIGLLVAVAIDGTNRVMTSPDGVIWTARPAAAANQWYGGCWSPELGLFASVAASGVGNRVMTSKSAYSYSYR